ncbi:hypothetical protein [Pseudorhodoferax soli]|uniref:Uncharacterized protein n=1 Tax=Pseudorhodoferax soli TaxID=545864 RepID=A0A368XAX9_9BURK|nr:hypothetical protein [Pseudorhodoferax soli]RCW65123.1 hypothetical protein DES41_11347 [Pseudorhodoferax soli]
MWHSFALEHPSGPTAGNMYFLTPSTALAGARIVRKVLEDPLLSEDEDDMQDWTEEEIVFLHWRLLQDVQALALPETPLDEKLATLRWIFTEPEKDMRPFSFANCLRVVGCSPLSPIAYCGAVDCETVRAFIAAGAKRWLEETLSRYPSWVSEALARNPEWIDAQLTRNPQWINEQLKRLTQQRDLFA